MDLTPAIPPERQVIETYGEGRFRISGMAHAGSVLVLPRRTLPWIVGDFSGATMESLDPLFSSGEAIEILLFGCGRNPTAIPAGLRAGLRGRGIVAEPMDTGAACRTYNVLLAEERRVAAALIAVT